MAEVKWIKIVTDIFDGSNALYIDKLPQRDKIHTIWIKLLCLAGRDNNSGVFMVNGKIPYDLKMFADCFKRSLKDIELAFDIFKQLEMIDIINDVVTVPNWEKYQNFDKIEKAQEQNRVRQKKFKEKQNKITLPNKKITLPITLQVTAKVTHNNATEGEGEEERDIEEDIHSEEGDIDSTPLPPKNDFTYISCKELYKQYTPTLYSREFNKGFNDDYKNAQAFELAKGEGMTEAELIKAFKAAECKGWIKDKADKIFLPWLIEKRKQIIAGKYKDGEQKSVLDPLKQAYEEMQAEEQNANN